MVTYRELIEEDCTQSSRNILNEYKHLSTEEVKAISDSKRLPFSVATLSVTGDLNVGSILRAAHLFGVHEAFVIGRRKLDKRPLVGMDHYMTIHRYEGRTADMLSIDPKTVKEVFEEHRLTPIMLETNGVSLPHVKWQDLFSAMPENTMPCLVLGNEGRGISDDVASCLRTFPGHATISIPQRGVCRSHNVASAAAIVMGHMVNQLNWWA